MRSLYHKVVSELSNILVCERESAIKLTLDGTRRIMGIGMLTLQILLTSLSQINAVNAAIAGSRI